MCTNIVLLSCQFQKHYFIVAYSTSPRSYNKITAELQSKTEIYSKNFKLKQLYEYACLIIH